MIDFKQLARDAHNAKHLEWDVGPTYQGEAFTDCHGHPPRHLNPGDKVECEIKYDDLPEDVRVLIEAIPELIAVARHHDAARERAEQHAARFAEGLTEILSGRTKLQPQITAEERERLLRLWMVDDA